MQANDNLAYVPGMEESFRVDNDGKAQWAMEKIRQAQQDTDKWKEHFAEQLARIKQENDSTIAFFTAHLERYFATVPHKVTKTGQEKYALPGGTLLRKPQNPQYAVEPDPLLGYLDAHEMTDYVKTERTPMWAELKPTLTLAHAEQTDPETGEVRTVAYMADANGAAVPGVTVTERPPVFQVQLGKEG